MKPTRRAKRLVAFATAACLASVAAASTQETSDRPAPTPTSEEMMQAWMKAAQPGEHHRHLARFEGRWSAEIRMWMQPGAEPMVNQAETEAHLILGGRYLEWTHTGEFDGMPFEGRQLDAYNNVDGRYEATWADNFGTLILYYTGECAEDGAVRTMRTQFTDALSGETVSQRAVYTWQDDDHWTYESYMEMDGTEFENMEIHYTRAE